MADDRRQPCQSTSRRRRRTGRKSVDGPHKRGLNTKIHLAVEAHGMPVRFFITSGTTADCTVAAQLIEGFQAEYLLADRGYDTVPIIIKAADQGMTPVIPPRKNRKHLREYDEYLYKLRHLVENAFLLLKRWRGIAYALRQKRLFVRRRCPDPLYCYLAPCLLTTPSSKF